MFVTQGVLPFKVELIEDGEAVTAHGALPLVVEALRRWVPERSYRVLAKALGYASLSPVRRHLESLGVLVIAGGEHLEDLAVLRSDAGLETLLGFRLSSPTRGQGVPVPLPPGGGRPPADRSRGRGPVGARQGDDPAGGAGADGAGPSPAGRGGRGPGGAHGVHRHPGRGRDDRRGPQGGGVDGVRRHGGIPAPDGVLGGGWGVGGRSVPSTAMSRPRLARRPFWNTPSGHCPPGSSSVGCLADTALYDEDALTWAADEGIGFAVSADLTQALAHAITEVAEDAWQPYRGREDREADGEERQWAEVVFVPNWARNAKKHGDAFRYLAIRVRSRQGELFQDSPAWRHFAVVTNLPDEGEAILRWQRGKQGTVEHGHGVMKNDLGGGVLPCGRFGANAAWWRLNVLAHNLLVFLQAGALPPALAKARPKTLRFCLFHVAGRVVRHARRWILKLSAELPWAAAFVQARRWLAAWAPS